MAINEAERIAQERWTQYATKASPLGYNWTDTATRTVNVTAPPKKVSITTFIMPSKLKPGEKGSFNLESHIDSGTLRPAICIVNKAGNPGTAHFISAGEHHSVPPGRKVVWSAPSEAGECLTYAATGDVYFDAPGSYEMEARAGYVT